MLPMAVLWFVGVLILAWYGVLIVRKGNAPDGRLTYREAAWLVRSERLVGLSLEEAQREIDGEIVATEKDPPQPAVAVADRKGKMLVMELEAGRVKKVEIR
ncbi:MAG TPA: hypothetical protein VK176_01870 [Phycisphaerales bacterium]|nr:hypothetical protein [Phycisphaerales bacterium]